MGLFGEGACLPGGCDRPFRQRKGPVEVADQHPDRGVRGQDTGLQGGRRVVGEQADGSPGGVNGGREISSFPPVASQAFEQPRAVGRGRGGRLRQRLGRPLGSALRIFCPASRLRRFL